MSPRRTGSLKDFAEEIEKAEQPDRELLRLTVERVREESPELADAIRYCAIPRRFDATVIGVLRGAQDDGDGNSRILAGVLTYNFAVPRRDGGYVYHDSVRESLLRDWRTPDNQEQFQTLNQRLVTFYESQQSGTDELESALGRVAATVQSASPARYAQLASNLESRILTPLLEGLYHQTLISPDKGLDLFRTYYERWESRGRVGICNALVNGFRDFLERLYSEEARRAAMLWVRYYDVRRSLFAGPFEASENKLRELLSEAGDDVTLKLWVLGDLGTCLHSQSKFVEARKCLEEAVELDQKTGTDPWNLPNWLDRIADIDWSLEELRRAEQSKLRAIEAAKNANKDMMVASSLLALSGILAGSHRFREAVQAAMEALDMARTKLREDIGTQRAVLIRFAYLAAWQSPALLETLKAELEAYFPPGETSYDLTQHRIRYVELLQQGGQLTRAAAAVKEVHEQVSTGSDVMTVTDVIFRKALLMSETGLKGEALNLYAEILTRYERGEATLWHRAAALHNRAGVDSDLALWAEAESDSDEARLLWEQMDHRVFGAHVCVTKATTLRKQGKMKDAEALLDAAGPTIEEAQSSYLPDYYRERGQIYRGLARWREAEALFVRAAEADAPSADRKRAMRHYGDLVILALLQGHWADAEKWSALVQQLSREMAEHESFSYSESQRQSDEENARGMHLFCTGAATDSSRGTRARELVSSAAARFPQHFWYLLNLVYVSAELREWREAADALESIQRYTPEWWCPALEKRLNEFRSQQMAGEGDALLAAGSTNKAIEQYQRAFSILQSSDSVDSNIGGSLESRLTAAMLVAGERNAAYTHFKSAYKSFLAGRTADPGSAIAAIWQAGVRGIKNYRMIDEGLKDFDGRVSSEGASAIPPPAEPKIQSLQDAVASARREIVRQADQLYGQDALNKPLPAALSPESVKEVIRRVAGMFQGRGNEKN